MTDRVGRLHHWHDVQLDDGAPWRVFLTPWLRRDGGELLGLTDATRRRIYVVIACAATVRATYVHEMLHAAFASVDCAKGDTSLEETLVRAAEAPLVRWLGGLRRLPPMPAEFRGLLKDEEG